MYSMYILPLLAECYVDHRSSKPVPYEYAIRPLFVPTDGYSPKVMLSAEPAV